MGADDRVCNFSPEIPTRADADAVEEGRKYCIETGSPMMIELMTYRIGHHTTSDDSLRCDDSCVCVCVCSAGTLA